MGKFMKFYIVVLLSLICFQVTAGVWTSGGGNALVYPDGTLRFLDITKKNEYPIVAPSKKVLEKIYSGPRKLKTLSVKFDKFYSMFFEVVSDWRDYSPALIDDILSRVERMEASFILYNYYKAYLKGDNSNLILYSPSARKDVQVLAASYTVSHIYFHKRIYDKLATDTDRRALVVHEGLRQYLYSLNQDWRNISISDLEEAVNIMVTQKPSLIAAKHLETIVEHHNTDYSTLINYGRELIDQLDQASALNSEEIKELLTKVTKFNQETSTIKHFNCNNHDLFFVVMKVFHALNDQFNFLRNSVGKNQEQLSILKNELTRSEETSWRAVADGYDESTNLVTQHSRRINDFIKTIAEWFDPTSDVKLKWGSCYDANTLKIVGCFF